ncbi:retrovirus-related pol polyprotein from transposon TNT 1-94 [Tanacetum coccineum]
MMDADKTAALKTDVYKKAHSALLLCLDNKVLREVNKESSAAGVWLKLETLYMTKSLANKLYLKKKLFTFYMHLGKKLSEHIDEFNKLIGDLANIDVDIDDEDQTLMLLTPHSRELKRGQMLQGCGGLIGYDNGDLVDEMSEERFLEWIWDFWWLCSYDARRYGNVIGYTVKLQNRRVKVIKGSLMVLSGTMKGNYVYSLDGWAESGEASVGIQEKESLAQVWHKRLGHISEAGLHELEKSEVLGNKGLVDMPVPSLSIVDDYSRRVWVHFLKHKNEAFSKFKEWKQLVENQTGRKLKKLRTDNGLEFCNQEFNNLCKESGIARHLTVAGTPQQNGLAERMNRTLLNKVRLAFLHGNLEEAFYMRQPPGFEEGTGNKVCLLKKSLYGLKQSPMQRYKRFDMYMISNGFSRNSYDSYVYSKEFAPGMYIYLLLYVDDMLIACKSKSEIEYTKGLLRKEFDMKELGPARKILGMEIMDNVKSVSMPLEAHFKVSLKDCPSNDWDVERISEVPYANAVGSFNVLVVCTRRIIAYVGNANVGRKFGGDVYGALQTVLKKAFAKRTTMSWDVNPKRTKHINVRYHFIREIVESKEIEVAKIGTKDNAADSFTKQMNRLSKRNLKIPSRFEDTIHELNGKLKNNKNKNKEVNDVEGCLDGANETGNPEEFKAFNEPKVDSSNEEMFSMNSGEMQGEEGDGNGVENKVLDANKSMDSNVVNGDGIEVDIRNGDDGCILEDVTPMMSKVHTTNVSSNTKNVHVTTPTPVNPLKQSYAKATTNFEVLIENKPKIIPTGMDENGDEYVIFDDEFVSITLEGCGVGMDLKRLLKMIVECFSSNFIMKKDINMSIDKTEPDKLPLWVRLCNLPLEAWTINDISELASRIGNPLIMDAMTTSMSKHGSGRIGYARVLVEVHAKKGLPENIECKIAAKEQNVNNTGNKGSSYEQDNNDDGFVNVQRKKVMKQNEVNQTKKRWELLIDKHPQSEEKGDLQNKKCMEEVEDVCDMDGGIAKDMNIGIWNIRGMGLSSKQDEIVKFIRDEKLTVCVNLESHLKSKKLDKVCGKIYGSWKWFSNMRVSDKGCRIIVGWDRKCVNVISVNISKQVILSGSVHMSNDMVDFNDCVNQIEVDDLCCFGLHFTWTKNLHKMREDDIFGILKKLDKVMVNEYFINNPTVLPISDSVAVFSKKLSERDENFMVRDVKDKEMKHAMFCIGYNKALGPDGFSAKFFKKAWHIVGEDVCKVVKEFFAKGQLLGELNATIISLVPKMASPLKVSDFRLIACCNVVYKCISKIIIGRNKGCLDKLINLNQSAFILGRQIQDNILLAQELIKGYNRKGGPKRITCKIDIQKAYDTLYYFKGGSGLRQGDPMSPYLFTLVMEYFTLIMEKNVDASPNFNYHFGCRKLKITHICFPDDLLVFCHGDTDSAKVIKDSIEEFGNCFGLLPNFHKSIIFFGSMN